MKIGPNQVREGKNQLTNTTTSCERAIANCEIDIARMFVLLRGHRGAISRSSSSLTTMGSYLLHPTLLFHASSVHKCWRQFSSCCPKLSVCSFWLSCACLHLDRVARLFAWLCTHTFLVSFAFIQRHHRVGWVRVLHGEPRSSP